MTTHRWCRLEIAAFAGFSRTMLGFTNDTMGPRLEIDQCEACNAVRVCAWPTSASEPSPIAWGVGGALVRDEPPCQGAP